MHATHEHARQFDSRCTVGLCERVKYKKGKKIERTKIDKWIKT